MSWPETTIDTVYDMASVTKVAATTMAAMRRFRIGDLSRRVSEFLPDFEDDEVTLRHLLQHDSGMPAYDHDVVNHGLTVEDTWQRLVKTKRVRPVGEETVYSCLNFILLKRCIDSKFPRFVVQCADANGLIPDGLTASNTAPTATMEPWRPKLTQYQSSPSMSQEFVQGITHDPLSYFLGGFGGNAGLFSTAKRMGKWAKRWVTEPESLCGEWQEWTRRQSEKSTRALGWDTKSESGSTAGEKFGPHSFGHLGFTGTSVWIDPEKGWYAVLLTNRVHPDDTNQKIAQVRPKFHDLVAETLSEY